MAAPRRRLVLELDADLLDDDWTERDLLDNAVHYFIFMVQDAEEDARDRGDQAYSLITDGMALYFADDYIAEVADADGLGGLAALPAEERQKLYFATLRSEET